LSWNRSNVPCSLSSRRAALGQHDHVHLARAHQHLEPPHQHAPLLDGGLVALAVGDVVDVGDPEQVADVLEDQRLEPVDRVDHQRLEAVLLVREHPHRLENVSEPRWRREARHVEVARAVLGAEEDRRRRLRRKRGLAHALDAVKHHPERALGAARACRGGGGSRRGDRR
jgi:hypothetical protein